VDLEWDGVNHVFSPGTGYSAKNKAGDSSDEVIKKLVFRRNPKRSNGIRDYFFTTQV
jgi:hypothetical protein